MGGDSLSEGRGFESWRRILDGQKKKWCTLKGGECTENFYVVTMSS